MPERETLGIPSLPIATTTQHQIADDGWMELARADINIHSMPSVQTWLCDDPIRITSEKPQGSFSPATQHISKYLLAFLKSGLWFTGENRNNSKSCPLPLK